MSPETWRCGDCRTEHPMSRDYCGRTGLDDAHLNLHPMPFAERWALMPVYLETAAALNITPPVSFDNPRRREIETRRWGSACPTR